MQNQQDNKQCYHNLCLLLERLNKYRSFLQCLRLEGYNMVYRKGLLLLPYLLHLCNMLFDI